MRTGQNMRTGRYRAVICWLDTHQMVLYLAAIAIAVPAGLMVPALAAPAERVITPALGLVLYATFLGIPFARLGAAARDWRFSAGLLALNFAVVPVVVFLFSRPVAGDPVLLLGVLLVLLCPCVDYVIVFSGLAGGAHERLLAAAPMLMLAQMLLLPGYLWLIAGPGVMAAVDLAPFAGAFVAFILLPLGAAVLTRACARGGLGRGVARAGTDLMVPFMVLTLFTVTASQIQHVRERAGALLGVIPVFVLFGAFMVLAGAWLGGRLGYDVAARRAFVFSGVTRNSLVVLPLALALPHALALAPLVVVTQTLVELLLMVVMIRLVPRLVPAR